MLSPRRIFSASHSSALRPHGDAWPSLDQMIHSRQSTLVSCLKVCKAGRGDQDMAQTTLRDYLQTTEDAISTGRVDDALANCQYILNHYPEALEDQRLLGE